MYVSELGKKKNSQEETHSLNDSGSPAPKESKVSFSRRGRKSRPTLWVNNCLRKTKKNKKSKNKLTGTGNNSAGRQEFFEVNVIFQIDNLHDSDNQLPQQ